MALGLKGLSSIGGIHRLELAFFEHGTQDTGIDQLGLFHESIDHGLGGCLHFFLDEADHGRIAFDLDVFS